VNIEKPLAIKTITQTFRTWAKEGGAPCPTLSRLHVVAGTKTEMKTTEREDVPLVDAVIAWTPVCSSWSSPGKIAVMKLGCHRPLYDKLGLLLDAGAVYRKWKERTETERLAKLYIEMWHIVLRDGLNPIDVHSALSVIPEYRDSLSEDFQRA
jgi:hypothetical protein